MSALNSFSNQELKAKFIQVLREQGYEYKSDIELLNNLKWHIERIYKDEIRDLEWEEDFDGDFSKLNSLSEQIILTDEYNTNQNYIQLINSFLNENDLIILINGLPSVYIKIETSATSTKDLWSQIEIDKVFSKLLKFIRVFVVSNGTETKYCSAVDFFKHSNNIHLYDSHWTDENNIRIENPINFARTFLSKQILLELLTRYYVYENFKVLKPYQFWAIKAILKKIYISIVDEEPSKTSGGYIFHSIGTGKTITSLKAAQLALKIPDVQKVIYIVHKSEILEKYTNVCISTKPLEFLKLLKDPKKYIIFTTILNFKKALTLINEREQYYQRIVIIVEECHKFTTNEFRFLIHSTLPKINLFGFTGTPLFWNPISYNASTRNIFGPELHSYKLIDAISDGNLLPFHVECVGSKNTFIQWKNPKRITKIIQYIVKNVGKSSEKYTSILTVESLKTAFKYYEEFQKQLFNTDRKIRVEILYYPSTSIDKYLRDFYKEILKRHQLESKRKIETWTEHKDFLFQKMKEGNINVLIVLNSFIDSLSISNIRTIWIDRNMQNHRLMHAISKTNKVYDELKTCGKIVCFRDISKEISKVIVRYCDNSNNTILNFEQLIKKFERIELNLMSSFAEHQEINDLETKNKFTKIFEKYMDLAETLSKDHRFEKHQQISEEQFNSYREEYWDIWDAPITKETNDEEVSDLEVVSSVLIDEEYIFNAISNLKQSRGASSKLPEISRILKTK